MLPDNVPKKRRPNIYTPPLRRHTNAQRQVCGGVKGIGAHVSANTGGLSFEAENPRANTDYARACREVKDIGNRTGLPKKIKKSLPKHSIGVVCNT